ncbi:hypothetical protein SKAU_G00103450 [Synaphobranchus kaupii]|uniref:Uncharacterized protein n=1 Tax=Synaphobranchus kaupii TaxID=118154 RepID=A0A9Q1FZ81_SYNKA|nr:hypothetical protein SKAU_G00103450 [Synaphobranchus kaupii]
MPHFPLNRDNARLPCVVMGGLIRPKVLEVHKATRLMEISWPNWNLMMPRTQIRITGGSVADEASLHPPSVRSGQRSGRELHLLWSLKGPEPQPAAVTAHCSNQMLVLVSATGDWPSGPAALGEGRDDAERGEMRQFAPTAGSPLPPPVAVHDAKIPAR